MDLPAFKKGMALLASDLNRLTAQVRASRITSVIGGKLDVSPGGTSLTIATQQNGAATAAAFYNGPWDLISQPLEEGETVPKYTIYEQSFLLKDENEVPVKITGLSEGDAVPFELPWEANEQGVIFLKIEFDTDMTILGAWLETGVLSDELWPDWPSPVERDYEAEGVDYARQKYLRVALHEVVEVGSTFDVREAPIYSIPQGEGDPIQVHVVQLIETDLILEWRIVDGLAAKVAAPWKRASRSAMLPPA